MNYEETLDYLHERTLVYYRVGGRAYRPGLERSLALDDITNNPHRKYKTIHVAGTNGKGSVSHTLAAILQAAGYKVGLYTSPHLVDFSERIRVNGRPITKQYVSDFVGKNMKFIEQERPSFFEFTTAMAFDFFRHKKVNYAIIETGLGGRLDSTNIISPILSIITSISHDHTEQLGGTLLKIAAEKAGIIKRNVPVVIGEMPNEEIKQFYNSKAFEISSPVILSTQKDTLLDAVMQTDGSWIYDTLHYGMLKGDLRGAAQKINTQTVLSALKVIEGLGVQVRISAIRKAFKNVTQLTGLMGRWQEVQAKPKVICDIGHNVGAWEVNAKQLYLESAQYNKTHIVWGMCSDKDIDGVLSVMPKKAIYYFAQADVERAMSVEEMAKKGEKHGLEGQICHSVRNAVSKALENAGENDLIFIGGSAFIVAEVLPLFPDAIK